VAIDRKSALLFVAAGLLVALGLALFVSPFASTSPDGLNKVAADKGLDTQASPHALGDSPLAGYRVKGIEDQRVSKALSGVIGVLITFGVALGLFGLLRLRRRPTQVTADAPPNAP
jgi:cobalt/nickel transport system permease protein